MVDILSGETRPSEPPPPVPPAPPARTGNDATAPIQQRGGAGQQDGRFFRGLAIFLVITLVFWGLVVAFFYFF
jgi:hypothetical protein